MDSFDDPEEMTPEQRLDEIAAILASGYLRLRRFHVSTASTENSLDCSVPPIPLCDIGLTRRDPEEHAA